MMSRSEKIAMLKRCFNANGLYKRMSFGEWFNSLSDEDINTIVKGETEKRYSHGK